MDRNIWHLSHEGMDAGISMECFQSTTRSSTDCSAGKGTDEPSYVEIEFEKGFGKRLTEDYGPA